MKLTVHFMQYGQTACQMAGAPKDWAAGHRWSSDWNDVTCEECLRGKEPFSTFTLGQDGKSVTITCNRCNRTSYSKNDVEYHFCGYCGVSHDDLFPPARRWWVEHPERDLAIVRCDCGWFIGIHWNNLDVAAIGGVMQCPKCKADLFERLSTLRTQFHEANKAH